jgi:hypothetical protein
MVGAGELMLAELGAAAPPAPVAHKRLDVGHHAAFFNQYHALKCAELQSTQYCCLPSGCLRAMQNLVMCRVRSHLGHRLRPNINGG